MSIASTINYVLLGQCCFTYWVLKNLVERNLVPKTVLIESAGIDSDPFADLDIEEIGWFSEHRIYHNKWLDLVKAICKDRSIDLIIDNNVIESLPESDALVVAGYTKKVPSRCFDIFDGWAMNVHPSLLPMYRGPQPEAQMILHDDFEYAGITIHKLSDIWDSGQIYWQKRLKINANMTIWEMEILEAEAASEGLNKLFSGYPYIRVQNISSTHNSSYYSWYSDSDLFISRDGILESDSDNLFRLRPEGYAFTRIGEKKFYPILGFSNNIQLKLVDRISCGVLESHSSIKYIDKNDVTKLLRGNSHDCC